MKKIGITQRVEIINNKNSIEVRDSLDQNWSIISKKLDFMIIPLPNIHKNYKQYLDSLNLDGIILSGGNSIYKFDKDNKSTSKMRDKFELKLINYCINNNLKILGVCRGMQMLNYFFKGRIKKIENHVNTSHKIKIISNKYNFPISVNSYHSWSIPKKYAGKELEILAIDSENNVEAFCYKKNILAMMWHPERKKSFDNKSLNIIKKFFK